jgi:hypothetical protein
MRSTDELKNCWLGPEMKKLDIHSAFSTDPCGLAPVLARSSETQRGLTDSSSRNTSFDSNPPRRTTLYPTTPVLCSPLKQWITTEAPASSRSDVVEMAAIRLAQSPSRISAFGPRV